MIKEKLVDVGAWAQARVDSGEEPPWTYHKLKQLAELAQELAAGLEAGVAYAPGMDMDEAVQQVSDNIVKFERPTVPEPPTNLPA